MIRFSLGPYFGFKFFFFGLGHDLGRRLGPNLVGLNGVYRSGPQKKICLINGPGPGRGSGYKKTRPVAIPREYFSSN